MRTELVALSAPPLGDSSAVWEDSAHRECLLGLQGRLPASQSKPQGQTLVPQGTIKGHRNGPRDWGEQNRECKELVPEVLPSH